MRTLTGTTASRIAGLTIAAALLAGCSGGDDVADAPAATEPDGATEAPTSEPEATSDEATDAGTEDEAAAATVSVVDFAFEPADVTVSPGETITWTNDGGGVNHTVTFNDGPDSGTLTMGQAFTADFDEPGDYTYFCRFHGQMQGTVTVEG